MKILNLVLYSTNSIQYTEMYRISRKYYHTFSNIDTYYYTFDNKTDITNQIDITNPTGVNISDEKFLNDMISRMYIIDDIIYIPGKESRVPGCLLKTILVFKFCKRYFGKYDYVIRPNISSIVNMDVLQTILKYNSLHYAGDLYELTWLDPGSGIRDNRYYETLYVKGIMIILSYNTMVKLLNNIDRIDITIVDDLCIGLTLKSIDIYPQQIGEHAIMDNCLIHDKIHDKIHNILCYRIKCISDRNIDIQNMKNIIDYLIDDRRIYIGI